MGKYLIKNVTVINDGESNVSDVLINPPFIERIDPSIREAGDVMEMNGEGKYLLPGIIDDQVHFREPGYTYKADIHSESIAAVAGGVTSYMEMPNTVPNVLTQELLEDKYQIATRKSMANYSFYMGASNDNLVEILKTDPHRVCGIKVFMGATTGNMLVDDLKTLESIFQNAPTLVATHCEDEVTLRKNAQKYREKYGEDIPISCHPEIRSEEACFLSSSQAVDLARQYETRLHILHISTAKELGLFNASIPLKDKKITSEACIHHLWFDDSWYEKKGALIKWNPAIKSSLDRQAIFQAVLDDTIDVIATDHAPHTLEEKQGTYFKTPSGGPLVQHSLVAMIEFYHQGKISLEKIVQKMAHHPAELFQIDRRGYIQEGNYADLVLVDLDSPWEVNPENILAKCGWSPFEGMKFQSKVVDTWVSGTLVYEEGEIISEPAGMRMLFNR
ncbi:dihydroorotase [Bacteroidota bacterium]